LRFLNHNASFHAYYVVFVPIALATRFKLRLSANDEQYALILRVNKNVLFDCVKIYNPVIDTPT